MANEGDRLVLDNIPKQYAYEDYISALLMTKGFYYLDRSIKKKTPGIGDELEIDIVLSHYASNAEIAKRRLVEIKSKGWGLDEIFKVRGWMDYMGFNNSVFIVQKSDPKSFPAIQNTANELDINLINNPEVDGKLDDHIIIDTLELSVPDVDNGVNQTIRFALHLERVMSDYLYKMKKSTANSGLECYGQLIDYWSQLNNNPFFEKDPNIRIKKIFNCWIDYKNISARIDHELNEEGWLSSDDCRNFVDKHYFKIYYEDKDLSPVVIAQHIELLNRLSILKACVDELVEPQKNPEILYEQLINDLGEASLPSNIKTGLNELRQHTYFHKYPRFWQIFIYVFGCFILNDRKNDDYNILSVLSGIPVDSIPDALKAFDILFPTKRDWMRVYNYTNITMLAMAPPPILGLGANFRRIIYRAGDTEAEASFKQLGTFLSGEHTLDNLVHWNNVAYDYLKNDDTLIKVN